MVVSSDEFQISPLTESEVGLEGQLDKFQSSEEEYYDDFENEASESPFSDGASSEEEWHPVARKRILSFIIPCLLIIIAVKKALKRIASSSDDDSEYDSKKKQNKNLFKKQAGKLVKKTRDCHDKGPIAVSDESDSQSDDSFHDRSNKKTVLLEDIPFILPDLSNPKPKIDPINFCLK